MASPFEGPVQSLVDELGRLPGIGPKSAQRIAFYLLKTAPEDAKRLLWLYSALMTVSFPVEVWRQARVPDSGAAAFDAVLEPAI